MIDFDALVLGPCMVTFGQACTYTPAGRIGPIAFTAVFEEYHTEISASADTTVPVLDTRPVLGCQLSAFPGGAPHTEELVTTADGRAWMIDEVLPDGAGHLKLLLKVAPNGMPAVAA